MAAPMKVSSVVPALMLLLSLCGHSNGDIDTDLSKLLIVVITQPNEYHAQQAERFVHHVQDQIPVGTEYQGPVVELTHARWPGVGAWTITPILRDIYEQYPTREWVMFCVEGTRITFDFLQDTLSKYDPSKPLFIGRGLRDQEATIIHHFAFHQDPGSFVYPDLAAGFLMSRQLIAELVERLLSSKLKSDFSIDAIHELAMYIRNDRAGYLLTEDDTLCAGTEHAACATTFPKHFPECGLPVSEDSVFFAVKTCTKFHMDRVPVVQRTWGSDARHLVFYSDTTDPEIPTQSTGVPNTERGHCGKMMVILNRFHQMKDRKFDWLVIADDDTLLSVERLGELLACYNPREPVALGERYGYSVTNHYGYDYITGGGGMVLSKTVVRLLLEGDRCACNSDDSPDDMTLGMCLKRLAIPITHSPLFHQARPDDYAKELLQHQRPVSFHKHWMIEPVSVYNAWFGKDSQEQEQEQDHDEL